MVSTWYLIGYRLYPIRFRPSSLIPAIRFWALKRTSKNTAYSAVTAMIIRIATNIFGYGMEVAVVALAVAFVGNQERRVT